MSEKKGEITIRNKRKVIVVSVYLPDHSKETIQSILERQLIRDLIKQEKRKTV